MKIFSISTKGSNNGRKKKYDQFQLIIDIELSELNNLLIIQLSEAILST